MARHVVAIPGWVPSSVNALYAGHWTARRRLKRADADAVALALEGAGVPRVAPPRSQVRAARASRIVAPIPTPAPARPPCRRRLEITFTPGPERAAGGRFGPKNAIPDPDNLNKSIRDAIVEGGWLVDDSAAWLEGVEPVVAPRDPSGPTTTLTIEDLDR